MTRLPHTRRLQVQNLESRELMAGNINASVVGGDLVLTGDLESNAVAIVQQGPGKYLVGGLVHAGGQTTITKAGVAANSHVLMGVTGDFEIRLRGGDDLLAMNSTGLPAGVKLLVPDDLNVTAGNGNDTVNLNEVQVAGDANILLGNDHDLFVMTRGFVGSRRGFSDSDLYVNGSSGNDRVQINQSIIRDDLYLPLGHGNNVATLNQVSVQDNATIATGDGQDNVSLYGSSVADDLLIHTGEGTDLVRLFSITADYIFAQTGAGHLDRLQVGGTHANNAKFHDSSGFVDILDLLAGNAFTNPPEISGFEY